MTETCEICGPSVLGPIMINGVHGPLCTRCGGPTHGMGNDDYVDGELLCKPCCHRLIESNLSPYAGCWGIVAKGYRTPLSGPHAPWRSGPFQPKHPPPAPRPRRPYGPPCAGCWWGTSYRGVRGHLPKTLLSEYELCPDCHAIAVGADALAAAALMRRVHARVTEKRKMDQAVRDLRKEGVTEPEPPQDDDLDKWFDTPPSGAEIAWSEGIDAKLALPLRDPLTEPLEFRPWPINHEEAVLEFPLPPHLERLLESGRAAEKRNVAPHVDLPVASVALVAEPLSRGKDGELVPNEAATKVLPEDSNAVADDCSASDKGKKKGKAPGRSGGGPFLTNDKGVYWVERDGKRHWLSAPVRVHADSRDRESSNWGRVFEFKDPDRVVHRKALPMRAFAGDGASVIGELMADGLVCAPGRKSRGRLLQYLQTEKTLERVESVDKTGWHETREGKCVFVLPECSLGPDASGVLFQTETRQAKFSALGNLEQWKSEIGDKCRANSRLVFAVSLALAASLLFIVGDESGGFHVCGSSSTGKTTMLRVAASVWGGKDFLHRWRTTANALEALALQHCDSLLILDEIAQVDAREAGEIAYTLGNGQGKARATRNGYGRPVLTWRVLFLSSGEIGLAEHMREVGKRTRAGQETRLVEIPADAGFGLGVFEELHGAATADEFANNLLDSASLRHGTLGPRFIELLLRDHTLWPKIRELRDRFRGDLDVSNSDGQVRRVASRFALVAAAGALVTAEGLTGWSKDEALDAVKKCFRAWVEGRGGKRNLEPARVVAQVRGFLELHGESRFTSWDDPDLKRVTLNRAGFRRREEGGADWFYILREAFRGDVIVGVNLQAAEKALLEHGALLPGPDRRPTRVERLPGLGNVRCYVIGPRIWEEVQGGS